MRSCSSSIRLRFKSHRFQDCLLVIGTKEVVVVADGMIQQFQELYIAQRVARGTRWDRAQVLRQILRRSKWRCTSIRRAINILIMVIYNYIMIRICGTTNSARHVVPRIQDNAVLFA